MSLLVWFGEHWDTHPRMFSWPPPSFHISSITYIRPTINTHFQNGTVNWRTDRGVERHFWQHLPPSSKSESWLTGLLQNFEGPIKNQG
jgi:hypothetical protein